MRAESQAQTLQSEHLFFVSFVPAHALRMTDNMNIPRPKKNAIRDVGFRFVSQLAAIPRNAITGQKSSATEPFWPKPPI